jgi:hypothetical protein
MEHARREHPMTTLDDVKKIAAARGDSVEQCLLDMLREAQAQTVQMRTEALLKLRALGNDPHLDGDARFEAGVMAVIGRVRSAAKALAAGGRGP